MKLDYLGPQTAKGYRYLSVPKELLENPVFSVLDYGTVILFAKMLERASLSARNEDRFTDEHGRLFIIYTVEQMEKDIQRSHPTVIKFTRQLADIGLIEKVRQGQGKPTRIYIKDFTFVDSSAPKLPDFNVCKSENLTFDSQENELLDVKNLSPIELNNKGLENKDPPTYFTEDDVENLRADVRSQIEYTVLCENYGEDLADEVVEIITETLCRDGPKMKIGNMNFPAAPEQQETQKNAKILATKKLLKNYRSLKVSIDCGTKHTQKLLADREYQSLMEKEESIANQKMSATALLTASNRVLWARLNTALDCFKEMCKADRSPSVQRGYPLIYARYLCESRMNLDAILERFSIEKSTYFRNMGAAVSTLSVILFGGDSAEDFCLHGNL